ncbi:MAG TPA: protoporphyrinogen oxidase HemJ [Bauldia sp.]|nr:protoporphyrinogen oxidase HemJ [Bauldia sp.]
MSALSGAAYDWVKAFHIIAVIAWMAGIFYLPRLFVYHADAEVGSDKSETFKVMERRLYNAIMTPAMVAVWFFGIVLATSAGFWSAHWLMAKLVFVIAMTGLHVWLGRRLREFAEDRNTRAAGTYRMVNEVPTLLVIIIVVLVVVKPF